MIFGVMQLIPWVLGAFVLSLIIFGIPSIYIIGALTVTGIYLAIHAHRRSFEMIRFLDERFEDKLYFTQSVIILLVCSVMIAIPAFNITYAWPQWSLLLVVYCAPLLIYGIAKKTMITSKSKLRGEKEVYIGVQNGSFGLPSPVFIDSQLRNYHHLVFGQSGFGKTTSIYYPLVDFDIKNTEFVLIIDFKGDVEFRDWVYTKCSKSQRKMYYFSIANHEVSDPYNFYGFGDPSAVKDKIISSTVWSEPIYKLKCQEEALRLTKYIIEKQQNVCTINNLLMNIEESKWTEGLLTSLRLHQMGSYGHLLQDSTNTIKKFYDEGSVVFISLDELTYFETAQYLGSAIFADISSLCGHVMTLPDHERKTSMVYIDEAAPYMQEGTRFIPTLSKMRAAKIGCVFGTQSGADPDPKVLEQCFDMTAYKSLMSSSNPESRELFSRLAGTKRIIKKTVQVDKNLPDGETGKGSVRDAHEYNIHPNDFLELDRGEGFLLEKFSNKLTKLKYNWRDIDTDAVKKFKNVNKQKPYKEEKLELTHKSQGIISDEVGFSLQ